MAGPEAIGVPAMRQASRQAMVFFAHGSRDPLWRRPAEAIAERVRQLDPKLLVRCAYLELTEPDLAACVAELVQLPPVTAELCNCKPLGIAMVAVAPVAATVPPLRTSTR